MNYREFKRLIAKSGMTLTRFSQLVGLHRNTIPNSHAKTGDVAVHWKIIVALMAELVELSDKTGNQVDCEKIIEKAAGTCNLENKPKDID